MKRNNKIRRVESLHSTRLILFIPTHPNTHQAHTRLNINALRSVTLLVLGHLSRLFCLPLQTLVTLRVFDIANSEILNITVPSKIILAILYHHI